MNANTMLLMIDNHDSFTYNLVQYFQCLGEEVNVFLNDHLTLAMIESLEPTYIVISPGPKNPDESGISLEAIRHFYKSIPILGVCLGHQALAQAFGGTIIAATEIIHGKTSTITHHNRRLFHNIPNAFQATRYHSLVVDEKTLPSCFEIDAWTDETIMGISHRDYPLYGVQFHPEAILTEHGMELLRNFLIDSLQK